MADAHKDYYAYVSKLGKNIDKCVAKDINQSLFDQDLDRDSITRVSKISIRKSSLNLPFCWQLILEHLLKNAAVESEAALEEESDLHMDAAIKDQLQVLAGVKNSFSSWSPHSPSVRRLDLARYQKQKPLDGDRLGRETSFPARGDLKRFAFPPSQNAVYSVAHYAREGRGNNVLPEILPTFPQRTPLRNRNPTLDDFDSLLPVFLSTYLTVS